MTINVNQCLGKSCSKCGVVFALGREDNKCPMCDTPIKLKKIGKPIAVETKKKAKKKKK